MFSAVVAFSVRWGFEAGRYLAILELSDTIKDVPAKDSKITRRNAAINGLLDPKPFSDELNRAWNFRTVGWGHGPEYWTEFVLNLRMIGYEWRSQHRARRQSDVST